MSKCQVYRTKGGGSTVRPRGKRSFDAAGRALDEVAESLEGRIRQPTELQLHRRATRPSTTSRSSRGSRVYSVSGVLPASLGGQHLQRVRPHDAPSLGSQICTSTRVRSTAGPTSRRVRRFYVRLSRSSTSDHRNDDTSDVKAIALTARATAPPTRHHTWGLSHRENYRGWPSSRTVRGNPGELVTIPRDRLPPDQPGYSGVRLTTRDFAHCARDGKRPGTSFAFP